MSRFSSLSLLLLVACGPAPLPPPPGTPDSIPVDGFPGDSPRGLAPLDSSGHNSAFAFFGFEPLPMDDARRRRELGALPVDGRTGIDVGRAFLIRYQPPPWGPGTLFVELRNRSAETRCLQAAEVELLDSSGALLRKTSLWFAGSGTGIFQHCLVAGERGFLHGPLSDDNFDRYARVRVPIGPPWDGSELPRAQVKLVGLKPNPTESAALKATFVNASAGKIRFWPDARVQGVLLDAGGLPLGTAWGGACDGKADRIAPGERIELCVGYQHIGRPAGLKLWVNPMDDL